jgi:hypothetical protein
VDFNIYLYHGYLFIQLNMEVNVIIIIDVEFDSRKLYLGAGDVCARIQ